MKRITFANVQSVAVAVSALGLVAILTAQSADAQSVNRRKAPTFAGPKAERVNNNNNGGNFQARIARPKGGGGNGNGSIQFARPKGGGGGNGDNVQRIARPKGGGGNGDNVQRIARPKGGGGNGTSTAQFARPKGGGGNGGNFGNDGGNGGNVQRIARPKGGGGNGGGLGNGGGNGGRVNVAEIQVPKSGRGQGTGGGNGGGLGRGDGSGGGNLGRNRNRGQVQQVALAPTQDIETQAAPRVQQVKRLPAETEQPIVQGNEVQATEPQAAPQAAPKGKATITLTEQELVTLIRKYRGLEVETYDEGGYETYYSEPSYGYSYGYGESCR